MSRETSTRRRLTRTVAVLVAVALAFVFFLKPPSRTTSKPQIDARRRSILDKCAYVHRPAGPDPSFASRRVSDRFQEGTPPTLIRNARIWTGDDDGKEVVRGDVLIDKGIIKSVGSVPGGLLEERAGVLEVLDAGGAWVTPGLVDLHSHIGVGSSPHLRGASDTNSVKAPILPWLRSLDGLNTHDESYALAMAGGVTTAQILPGSANNIGGQAFVMKLRPTKERSPTSMLIEPPWSLNGSHSSSFDYSQTPRWRHMKHACGENPSRVYAQTRMDSAWQFRHAYDEARKVRDAEDAFCDAASSGDWVSLSNEDGSLRDFPESLQWEALVDVLRGRVKLAVHCYEAVDLDGIVRLTNEFKFPVASFHHAGETYLVPDLLKKAWNGAPAIALFASNFGKKREAYRGSEFAPAVLAESGIPVVMKSDHPVINSRYLLNEAGLAHYHGLPANLALASVTTTPAKAAGLDHRVGKVVAGYDADVVIWDSHPLSLAATPVQVYVDGIPQLNGSFTSTKPETFQHPPSVPDFSKERKEAVEWQGLPQLTPTKSVAGDVLFMNVTDVFERKLENGQPAIKRNAALGTSDSEEQSHSVLVRNGRIVCIGTSSSACVSSSNGASVYVVDLEGGVLAPGFTSFGSPLGLVEIRLEPSTNDGFVLDVLSSGIGFDVLKGEAVRAVDGLQFGGRNTLLAYRSGVTRAVSAPVGSGPLLGLSTVFSTSALSGVEDGAILQDVAALHARIAKGMPASVSTQIAWLRQMLLSANSSSATSSATLGARQWAAVHRGELTLVAHVDSADIMASLLQLRLEVSGAIHMTFAGASEAHLLAKEIADAGVSVVLSPSKPFPGSWDQRRILPGPPLSNYSAIVHLMQHGVNVAIGVVDEFDARNTRFNAAWAAFESHGIISESDAIAMVTTNLEKALGYDTYLKKAYSERIMDDDIVAFTRGRIFSFDSKAVAIASSRVGRVDIL